MRKIAFELLAALDQDLHVAVVIDDEPSDTVPDMGNVPGPFLFREVVNDLKKRRILAKSSCRKFEAGVGRMIAKSRDLKFEKI